MPLRTEQYNPKQLNSPNFVSSFRYGEHVYFLFREIAIEHLNCGKIVYSRIARVCLNDAGGATTRNRERWTSFTKARLNCSIPGEFPFAFDEIQASSGLVRSGAYPHVAAGRRAAPAHEQATAAGSEDLVYAVFTTPTNSIGGSAVCAYRMADVLAAFEGPFKAQADSNSNWLPVAESRVPQPRPGTCVNDSKRLPEEHINFIRDNPLMDTTVQPVWAQPLITMASINFRFTSLVVDAQVETPQAIGAAELVPAMRTDVIFVGTDDGRAFKLTNTFHLLAQQRNMPLVAQGPTTSALQANTNQLLLANSPGSGGSSSTRRPSSLAQVGGSQLTAAAAAAAATPTTARAHEIYDISSSTIVIEELHLFDSRTPITSMLLARARPTSYGAASSLDSPPRLLVMSHKQIKAVPLSRCERALSCLDCLSLLDPYCAWDLSQGACLALGHSTVIPPPGPPGALAQPEVFDERLFSAATGQLDPRIRFTRSAAVAVAGPTASAQTGWFPPNMSSAASNHTLGWWSSAASCPTLTASGEPLLQQQQVGAPYRSLFSSHLQVPSRYDYQSGHHLSRSALAFPFGAPSQTGAQGVISSATAGPLPARQPASECLTFCGGGPASLWSPSGADPGQAHQSQNHHLQQGVAHLLNQNFYTSENLLMAVIICALVALLLGLLIGFTVGKNSRSKNESSICSSTFDETNLYMASTGSHGGGGGACHTGGGGLFAPLACHPNSTVARLTSHPAYLASQAAAAAATTGQAPNNYASLASNSHQARHHHQHHLANGGHQRQQSGGMFEASQSLLAAASDHSSGIGSSTYANQQQQQQQQLIFQQQQNGGPHERSPSIRTGALPPIPTSGGQQPLVAGGPSQTIHLQHSGGGAQLTPNSQSSNSQPPTSATSTSSAGSSVTSQSTLQVADAHHQNQFYLNQQQVSSGQQQQHQQHLQQNGNGNLHQRSFTNSSSGSGKGSVGQPLVGAKGAANNSTFLAQQQQQQQANNKIYL